MHALFFDVTPKPGHMEHYFAHVERLRPVLARHAGMHYLERFMPLDDPDSLLSHQLWEDEAAIAAWRSDRTHRSSQDAGRRVHFASYRIRVGPQLAVFPGGDSLVEGARLVVAAYGASPVLAGIARGYASVTREASFLSLAQAASAAEAMDLAHAGRAEGAERVRVFGVSRDYTMTERAEAPTA